jgi:type II secretory pathway pseudopilin PulG
VIELLIVVAILGIVAAIAIPGLLRARIAGNEASAIGSMRAIQVAQAAYTQQCWGYSPSLPELKNAGNFLSADLTGGAIVAKSGFNVTVQTASAGVPLASAGTGCTGTVTDFFAHTEPIQVGRTGNRSFATTSQSTIYYDMTGAPIADPIPAGTKALQ